MTDTVKLRLTFDIEVSDLPDDVRAELQECEGEHVPTLAEHGRDEIQASVIDALDTLCDTYDTQADLWAGTSFYGYMSSIRPVPADTERERKVEALVEAAEAFSKMAGKLFADNFERQDLVTVLRDTSLTAGDFFKLRQALHSLKGGENG